MAEDTANGDLATRAQDPKRAYVRVNRPAYRLSSFRDEYQKAPEPPKSIVESAKEKLGKAFTCDKAKAKKMCMNTFPFLRIMRKYQWRDDLINDIISGLTVGIMQLPQGMAYAMLAELPPVVGLYVSFFPVVIYFFFGTSKQVSIGTVAVISLLTGGIVARETDAWKAARAAVPVAATTALATTTVAATTTAASLASTFSSFAMENATKAAAAAVDSSGMDLEERNYRIQIATTVAFVTGLSQIALGLCRVGFVTTYMGDSLVSGFTTGAAVHVFTSQVKYALGLKIPRYENLYQVIQTYIAIFKVIGKTNIAELVMTAICIVLLYVTKTYVNPRVKTKCRVPIPIELIVVVVGTLASHYGGFRAKWGIRTVGKIPAGLPEPAFPSMVNVSSYGFDSVVIGIVAFAQSVSLACLLAKKYKYNIDANKEFIGYGAATFFGSFFSCYPIAASVSRSSVQDAAGGRTQLASLISAVLVLVVILFIGPLFEELPNCCLSAIIMVALKSMFMQILELKKLYRISPYDCAIWVVTFGSVVALSVDLGLYIGIVFAFFTVVTRSQMASVKTVENVADNDLYRSTEIYTKTEPRAGIKVIAYNTPLYYANGELFLKHVYRVTEVRPERLRKVLRKLQASTTLHSTGSVIVDEHMNVTVEMDAIGPSTNGEHSKKEANGYTRDPADPRPFRHLVIDCSSMSFVDPVGIKTLKQLIDEYKEVGITIYLGGIRDEVFRTMQEAEFTAKYQNNIYLTVYDAVQMAKHNMQNDTTTADTQKQKARNADPEAGVEDQLLTNEERT